MLDINKSIILGIKQNNDIKNKINKDKYNQMIKYITTMGEQVNINFDFNIEKDISNTLNSHKLIYLSGLIDTPNLKFNYQARIVEDLYRSHFIYHKNIQNINTLIEIGVNNDINKNVLIQYLTTNLDNQKVLEINKKYHEDFGNKFIQYIIN